MQSPIHAVKANIGTFLGRSPVHHGDHQIGDFSIRTHGTRLRDYIGPTSIKVYDKHSFILRVEIMTDDVTLFRHHSIADWAEAR